MDGEPSQKTQIASLVLIYLNRTLVDEETALKIVRLPLLDDIEFGDEDALGFLSALSRSDPDGLIKLLSHEWLPSGDETPIQLLYLASKNPAAAAEIAAQEWVQDGLLPMEIKTLTLLQEAATNSQKLFRYLMDGNASWIPLLEGAASSTLKILVAWSQFDEDTAVKLVAMPFMETIESADYEAVRRLNDLAGDNPDGVQHILSHPFFGEGITDELAIYVPIFYLEQVDSELAAAINNLPWVKDGITYVPQRNWGSSNRDPKEREAKNILRIVDLGIRAPDFLRGFAQKSWGRDGLSFLETNILLRFHQLRGRGAEVIAQLLNMPFLDTIQEDDLGTLWVLDRLARNDGNSLKAFLSDPALAGGITDDKHAVVKLLEVRAREPEEYASLEALAWIQDGISESEYPAISILTELSRETDSVFSAVLDKPWVRDGLTGQEVDGVSGIVGLGGESYGGSDVQSTLRIVNMPFLDTFEGFDSTALSALSVLSSGGYPQYLRQVLEHPSLSEGIMDRETLIISVLYRVVRDSPEKLDSFLDPDQIKRQDRVITLPLAGEITAATIHDEPGTFRTLDILEETVRQQETFMNVTYPSNLAGVAVLDLDGVIGEAGIGGIITIISGREEDAELIAHEAAHAYWGFSPAWIAEGAAELMAKIAVSQLDQAPASPGATGCSLANTIGDLDQLVYYQNIGGDEVYWSRCMYTMGLGLYADLYNGLGDEEFRRGFGGLYLKMRHEEHNDECFGVERGLCYVRKAFVEDASPGFADDADEVINRWYYGVSQ